MTRTFPIVATIEASRKVVYIFENKRSLLGHLHSIYSANIILGVFDGKSFTFDCGEGVCCTDACPVKTFAECPLPYVVENHRRKSM